MFIKQKLQTVSLLALVCSLMLFAGAGCRSSATNTVASTSTAPVALAPLPAYADPQGLSVSENIQSREIRDQVKTAAEANPDFQLLIKKAEELGFSWSPMPDDFMAETDADKTPLVGVAQRRSILNTAHTSWLVGLFVLDGRPIKTLRYAYLVDFEPGTKSALTRYWVEDGSVRSRVELSSSQKTYHLEK